MSFYDGGVGENFVESKIQDTPQARSFSIAEAQPIRSLTCRDDATFIMKVYSVASRFLFTSLIFQSAVSKHEVVSCPENCGGIAEAAVFGNGNCIRLPFLGVLLFTFSDVQSIVLSMQSSNPCRCDLDLTEVYINQGRFTLRSSIWFGWSSRDPSRVRAKLWSGKSKWNSE